VTYVTKFYITWQLDPARVSDNPEDMVKHWLAACEMVKADMKTYVKDWGICAGGSCGYSISEAPNETELLTNLMKYMPFVQFEVNPVLTVDQAITAVKKAAAAAKK
jgi:hypothetical protein